MDIKVYHRQTYVSLIILYFCERIKKHRKHNQSDLPDVAGRGKEEDIYVLLGLLYHPLKAHLL